MISATSFKRGHCWVLAAVCMMFSAVSSTQTTPIHQLGIITLRFTATESEPAVDINGFLVLETGKQVVQPGAQVQDYAVIFRDAGQQGLDTIYLADPLHEVHEYPTANGELRRAVLDREENEVMIRFPYTPAMHDIQIGHMDDTRRLNIVRSIPLPEPGE